MKLGHPLALSVAASSTVPVTYSVPAKELPAGITLDRSAGLLFGAPRVSGRFVLHITATSSAGSATRAYTVVVPAVTHLVTGSASAVTPRSGASVLVTIRGLPRRRAMAHRAERAPGHDRRREVRRQRQAGRPPARTGEGHDGIGSA